MTFPDHLDRKELVDLLNKCWMTHDGMWFLHSLQHHGINAANKANKAAIASLAAIEIGRMKKALGFEGPIDTAETFKRFFSSASDLLIPDFMNIKWHFPSKDRLTWAFEQGNCFAYKGIRRMGVIDKYECGVLHRVRCWLDVLEIPHEFDPQFDHCLMHTRGECSGTLKLQFQGDSVFNDHLDNIPGKHLSIVFK
jgi:hypothetical protein